MRLELLAIIQAMGYCELVFTDTNDRYTLYQYYDITYEELYRRDTMGDIAGTKCIAALQRIKYIVSKVLPEISYKFSSHI
jgi:hypothetical protein